MNMIENCWVAVALTSEIRRAPKRILFNGQPVAVFHTGQQVAALVDRCPHRLVELSGGKVIKGEIECPYHGWRFNAAGACTAIPGLTESLPRYHVPTFRTFEKDGVVFLAKGEPKGEPYLHAREGEKIMMRLVESSTQSTLIDAAENILDATHTHFTHKWLLRGLGSKRQRVRVDVTGGEDWVEARYTGETRQQGLISGLLEGERSMTIGRFRYPGIAELEYWGKTGLALTTTFHLRQSDDRMVQGIGCLIGPANGVLDYLKSLAFRPMFSIALAQDRRVLKSASDNAALAHMARPVIGPLDFLRRDIEAIMDGRNPSAMATPRTFYIDL